MKVIKFCTFVLQKLGRPFSILIYCFNQQLFDIFSKLPKETGVKNPHQYEMVRTQWSSTKKIFKKAEEATAAMSGSVSETRNGFSTAQSLWKLWTVQVGTAKAQALQTTQGSDDTGMKDNNESFPISTDNEEEKGYVGECRHWQTL